MTSPVEWLESGALLSQRSVPSLAELLPRFEAYIQSSDPDSPILQQVWGYLNALTSEETA